MTAVTQFKSGPPATGVAKHGLGYKLAWFFLNNGIIIALLVEILIFSLLAKEKFFNINVFAIILQSAAAVGIIMPFYTLAMISGNVDFSTTQVGALAGTVFAVLLTYVGLPVWAAVTGALILGIGVSALNSWVVIRLRIPSLIATLVSGSVAFGLAYLLAEKFGNALQVKVNAPVIRSLWTIKPFGLPIPLVVYVMLICYVIVYILLNHTRLGSHLYALGSNAEAAIRSGNRPLRLIFASSDQVYPGPAAKYRPADETHPLLPNTFYGLSKVLGEDMIRFYGRTEKDVNISIARFTHTEAPEELIDPNGFFAHRLFFINGRLRYLKGMNSSDPKILETIQALEPLAAPDEPLLLPRDRDGHPFYQELTDVRDIVRGLLLILDRREAIGEAFNLTPPAITNMAEFIPYMAKKTGRRYLEARLAIDPPNCHESGTKARTILGYQPQYSMFDMIDEAVTPKIK